MENGPTLTESMQMVDEILSDGQMDGLEKIEKLEAILSAVTHPTSEGLSPSGIDNSPTTCSCSCQGRSPRRRENVSESVAEVGCQTLSTGDIVITRIFLTEEEKERERLLSSPRK